MAATLTPANLKKWMRTTGRNLIQTVIDAREFATAERARVDAYALPIFKAFQEKYGWVCSDSGQPVTTPRHLFLVDDQSGQDEFYAALLVAHREHGWTGPNNHCPACVAENARNQAEHALITSVAPLMGVKEENIWGKNREELLALLLDLHSKVSR